MNDLEERLRRALNHRADLLVIDHERRMGKATVPTRGPDRSRQRLLIGAVAAIVLLAGVLVAVRARDEQRTSATPAERLRRSFSNAAPLFALTSDFALTRDGHFDPSAVRVSILRIESGGVKTVPMRLEPGYAPLSLSRSATGTTVVAVASPTNPACSEPAIVLLRPDGTISAPIASGQGPSVSPDGERLAYLTGGDPACGASYLVVRDLASGAERRWLSDPKQSSQHAAGSSAWSPDGTSLAFGTGDGWLRVLNVDAPGDTLAGARPVHHFRLLQQYPVWSAATRMLYGSEVVTQGPDRSPLQEIDPATGQVVRELTQESEGPFAISPDGRLAAYVVRISGTNGFRFNLRITDGSSTITMAEGAITQLAW